jgi:tetratricopeptide (TPR) repeat protein
MNNNFEIVEKYLYQQLTDDEKASFEAKLAQDEGLQEELALQQLEQDALDLLEQEQLRNNLKLWKAERTTTETQQSGGAKIVQMGSSRLYMRWAAAASVFLMLAFVSQRWANSNYSDEALAANFMEENNTGTSRSRGQDASELSQALAIQATDPSRALVLLKEVNDSSLVDRVALIKAQCYSQLKQYDTAIAQFQEVIANYPTQKENAEWNLLLAYLASGKHEAEVGTLKQAILSNTSHNYYPNTKKLDAEMNSFWRNFVW